MHNMDIKLGINWQINHAEEQAIDPVLFQLLESIQKGGSLKSAAAQASVSYRFAWGLLARWEQLLKQPLVILEQGRGARLAPPGEKILNANLQLLARFTPELENFATQFKREFDSILTRDLSPSLRIFASHGLAIGVLRDLINQQPDFKLDLHFHGSIESLRSLNHGDCDIAGFHIPVGSPGKELTPNYLAWLDQNTHQLIYVVKRNQGLMVQADNPKNISSISSLTDQGISFINRQEGSGTRLLFDLLLRQQGIHPDQINGYKNEEFTHMAVAAMVASGAVDCGFGIAPMAAKFHLEFIPLIWEHYCLALPITIADDDRVSRIKTLLQSKYFKQRLNGFSGYDTARSGIMVDFDEIFPT